MSLSSSLTMNSTECKDGEERALMSQSNGKKEGSKVGKKRCRASRVTPTIVVTTDVSSFRAKVQKFTGMQCLSNENCSETTPNPTVPAPLKPMAKRPIDQVLPALTSGYSNFNSTPTSFFAPNNLSFPSMGSSMSLTSYPPLLQQQQPQAPPNTGLFSLHPFFNTITANMNKTRFT